MKFNNKYETIIFFIIRCEIMGHLDKKKLTSGFFIDITKRKILRKKLQRAGFRWLCY